MPLTKYPVNAVKMAWGVRVYVQYIKKIWCALEYSLQGNC